MTTSQHQATGRPRNAVKSAFWAYYVDMLDIYLPILVLAPAITYFVSPELSAAWTAVASATIFIGTLLGRPVGAAIFGPLADKWGRKQVAVITMGASGCATLSMGLLLGYQSWGAMAVVLFVLMRFVNGVFIGGQYTAANPLAMEASPKHKRGLYGAAINCAFPVAYVTVALATSGLLAALSSDGVGSSYVQWGWRVPFLVVGVFELVLTAYYVRSVDESTVWEVHETEEAVEDDRPRGNLFRSPEKRRTFVQVFILMSGLWLALQSVAAILPSVLGGSVGLAPFHVTLTLIVAYIVLIGANLTAGITSQRFGRRPTLATLGVLIATVGMTLYFLLIRFGEGMAFPLMLLVVIAVVCLIDSPFALVIAYINERFQVSERAAGYGLSYSLSVVLPSFYAYYQLGLSTVMPFDYTVLVLIVVGGTLIVLGALLGPETRDVDFAEPPRESDATGPANQAIDRNA